MNLKSILLSLFFIFSFFSSAIVDEQSFYNYAIYGPLDLKLDFWRAPIENKLSNSNSANFYEFYSLGKTQKYTVELAKINKPGTVGFVKIPKKIFVKQPNFTAEIIVYSKFPKKNKGYPPYINISVELIHPVRAKCQQLIKFEKNLSIPHLICTGTTYFKTKQNYQYGLTLFQ